MNSNRKQNRNQALNNISIQVSLPKDFVELTNATASIVCDLITPMKPLFDFSAYIAPIVQHLNQIAYNLSGSLKRIDWDDYRAAYHSWGEYGWIVPDDMTPTDIKNIPASIVDADLMCLNYYKDFVLEDMFERLEATIRKKKDLHEALWLFQNRRYKPCAMMLCSLIDGELLSLAKSLPAKQSQRKWLKPSRAFDIVEQLDIPKEGFLALSLENMESTWKTFFRSGENFSREIEGELNRNFLMHGMMHKPVRRKTCIKLFALLDAILGTFPDALAAFSPK